MSVCKWYLIYAGNIYETGKTCSRIPAKKYNVIHYNKYFLSRQLQENKTWNKHITIFNANLGKPILITRAKRIVKLEFLAVLHLHNDMFSFILQKHTIYSSCVLQNLWFSSLQYRNQREKKMESNIYEFERVKYSCVWKIKPDSLSQRFSNSHI